MKSDNINESDNVNEKENITAKSGGCAECTATLTDDVKSNSTMLEAAAELIKKLPEHTQGYVAKMMHAHPLKAMLETRF